MSKKNPAGFTLDKGPFVVMMFLHRDWTTVVKFIDWTWCGVAHTVPRLLMCIRLKTKPHRTTPELRDTDVSQQSSRKFNAMKKVPPQLELYVNPLLSERHIRNTYRTNKMIWSNGTEEWRMLEEVFFSWDRVTGHSWGRLKRKSKVSKNSQFICQQHNGISVSRPVSSHSVLEPRPGNQAAALTVIFMGVSYRLSESEQSWFILTETASVSAYRNSFHFYVIQRRTVAIT